MTKQFIDEYTMKHVFENFLFSLTQVIKLYWLRHKTNLKDLHFFLSLFPTYRTPVSFESIFDFYMQGYDKAK